MLIWHLRLSDGACVLCLKLGNWGFRVVRLRVSSMMLARMRPQNVGPCFSYLSLFPYDADHKNSLSEETTLHSRV